MGVYDREVKRGLETVDWERKVVGKRGRGRQNLLIRDPLCMHTALHSHTMLDIDTQRKM